MLLVVFVLGTVEATCLDKNGGPSLLVTSSNVRLWIITDHVNVSQLYVVLLGNRLEFSFSDIISSDFWLSILNVLVVESILSFEDSLMHDIESMSTQSKILPCLREQKIGVGEVN